MAVLDVDVFSSLVEMFCSSLLLVFRSSGGVNDKENRKKNVNELMERKINKRPKHLAVINVTVFLFILGGE